MNLVDIQDAIEHGQKIGAKHQALISIEARQDGIAVSIRGASGELAWLFSWHQCHQATPNILIAKIDEGVAKLGSARPDGGTVQVEPMRKKADPRERTVQPGVAYDDVLAALRAVAEDRRLALGGTHRKRINAAIAKADEAG